MEYPKLIQETIALLEEKKGEEIIAIDVRERTPFTDFYILVTAPNMRAVGAYAESLEEFFEDKVEDLRKIEGQPESGWVLVDGGEVVVHIFTEQKRRELSLEDLFLKSLA